MRLNCQKCLGTVSEHTGRVAVTGGQIDAGVSTRFVWITGWTPHPLDFQGADVREVVAA